MKRYDVSKIDLSQVFVPPPAPRPRKEYSQQELEDAFKLIRPKGHWKDPIRCVLKKPTEETLDRVSRACSHFTGSLAEFETLPNGDVRVTAAGYYLTIGA
jgi:hypothetical protein